MTTLTIRIDDDLKRKAFMESERLGIPLTLIIKNTLVNFVKSPKIIIGEPEVMEVTLPIQRKMDKIGKIIAKM